MYVQACLTECCQWWTNSDRRNIDGDSSGVAISSCTRFSCCCFLCVLLGVRLLCYVAVPLQTTNMVIVTVIALLAVSRVTASNNQLMQLRWIAYNSLF